MDLVINDDLISRLLQGRSSIADPFTILRQQKDAQRAVPRAILAGMLARPSECSACHSAGKMQAHHEDYGKPLEVQWLCGSCHRKADRARRLREGQRDLGREFAAFLFLNGGVSLPFCPDPPENPPEEQVGGYGFGYHVQRAICRIDFAGFDKVKETPVTLWELSCGHKTLQYATELCRLPTIGYCDPCTDIGLARWERWVRNSRKAERAQARGEARA